MEQYWNIYHVITTWESQLRRVLLLKNPISNVINKCSKVNGMIRRMVSIWNRLPTDLRQEQSLDGLVRKLNIFFYYYLKFQNSFNCDKVCKYLWMTGVCVIFVCINSIITTFNMHAISSKLL